MTTFIKEISEKMQTWSGTVTLLAAVDTDKYVTTTNMKVGTYTIAAQPSAPSVVTVTATANGTADTMGTITVVGTDIYNAVQTEVIIPVADSTVSGSKFFKTLTSITGAGWIVDVGVGNDTIVVGTVMSAGITAIGRSVTFVDISGNIWINPNTTATEANGFPLTSGQDIDLLIGNTLSVISDSSGATCKYIVWEE